MLSHLYVYSMCVCYPIYMYIPCVCVCVCVCVSHNQAFLANRTLKISTEYQHCSPVTRDSLVSLSSPTAYQTLCALAHHLSSSLRKNWIRSLMEWFTIGTRKPYCPIIYFSGLILCLRNSIFNKHTGWFWCPKLENYYATTLYWTYLKCVVWSDVLLVSE